MRSVSLVGVAAATCVLLAVSACSSSTSSGGGSGSAAVAGGAPNGSPIVIGAVSPVTGAQSVPVWQDGVKAAVQYVNSTGGVNGRPIKLEYCDDVGQDASKNAACVRSFIAEKATAILSYGAAMGTSIPIAQAAGIGVLSSASTTIEQKISNSIILHADATSGFSALFKYAKDHGKNSASGMVINIPEVFKLFDTMLPTAATKGGMEWMREVPVDPTGSDFTPALLQASRGADMVVMAYGPGAMAQTVKDGQANGVSVQFGGTNTLIDKKNFLTPAGSAAEGVLAYAGVTPFTATSDPDVAIFRDQMTKAGFAGEISVLPEIGFSYAMTAFNVLKKLRDSSSTAFLDYFKHNKVPIYLGQTYDGTRIPFPDRPAVHVTAVRILQVRNGEFVDADGTWEDAFGS